MTPYKKVAVFGATGRVGREGEEYAIWTCSTCVTKLTWGQLLERSLEKGSTLRQFHGKRRFVNIQRIPKATAYTRALTSHFRLSQESRRRSLHRLKPLTLLFPRLVGYPGYASKNCAHSLRSPRENRPSELDPASKRSRRQTIRCQRIWCASRH